jgi:hypothetical protein
VRLSDSYLRSIAYIGRARSDGEEGIATHGTGFLLAHDGHVYLVTAAHVANDFRHGVMDVRLNKQEHGLGAVEHFEDTNWFFHEDSTVDVAVMPFSIPRWARAEPLKSKWIATKFKIGTKNFGTGDLAYVVGIFNKMRGKDKNEPFVHTGHVASMGYGEIATMKDWRPGAKADATVEVKGYFVQATTLPESSGSPVFIRRSIQIKPVEMAAGHDPNAPQWVFGSVWLLGLWSGNWNTRHDDKVVVGDDMGLCIPALRILEVLERQELKDMRQAAKDREANTNALTPQPSMGSNAVNAVVKERDETLLATPPQPREPSAKKRVKYK